ncbi:MAG: hypothetical protein AAF821_12905 [Cyanobacteria bacterium P01_D01_bin.156]
MAHGLLWLPLLVFFFWITWAGWNEYQKVETYKQWATQFERAKYDIFAALGQSDRTLTWGLPTRQGIVNLQTLNLNDIEKIEVLTKKEDSFRKLAKGDIKKSEAFIQFQGKNSQSAQIPFTDVDLAHKWHAFLVELLTKTDNFA